MAQEFDLDDFNMLDIKAQKVLIALSQFEHGLLVKGELLHKKTGLLPQEINHAIRT